MGFAFGASGIQATLSATEMPDSSYFKEFRGTQGALTPGLNHMLLNTTDTGFEALHGYTHLSKTIDFFWKTFVGFGYIPTMVAASPESVEYLFANGGSQYRAVFSITGEDVKVSFTPVATLVASR